MRQVGRLGGLALAALLALGGCDGSSSAPPASSSTAQATVKGKVTHKGKALSKVEVRFNPANVNRKSAATVTTTTNDDGSYELSTLVGENTVSLGGAVVTRNPALSSFTRPVELKAGDNPSVDLDIP